MIRMDSASVAIVDFGLGNLYSVKRTCEYVGLRASITSDRSEIERADGIILPGVGAFGDAMAALKRNDLVGLLRDAAAANRPLMGICLGVQLLMTQSEEFGNHEGLDIFKGSVVRFRDPCEGNRNLKIPHVGWSQISPAQQDWKDSPLQDVTPGEFMYFVHSFCVQPAEQNAILSLTRYGQIVFCSSIQRGNLFACQFHPERSGVEGLKIYASWARLLGRKS